MNDSNEETGSDRPEVPITYLEEGSDTEAIYVFCPSGELKFRRPSEERGSESIDLGRDVYTDIRDTIEGAGIEKVKLFYLGDPELDMSIGVYYGQTGKSIGFLERQDEEDTEEVNPGSEEAEAVKKIFETLREQERIYSSETPVE